jgi:hypothetical protein
MLLCPHRLKHSPPEIARRVVRIQILTFVWMTVEAVVVLGAGTCGREPVPAVPSTGMPARFTTRSRGALVPLRVLLLRITVLIGIRQPCV